MAVIQRNCIQLLISLNTLLFVHVLYINIVIMSNDLILIVYLLVHPIRDDLINTNTTCMFTAL